MVRCCLFLNKVTLKDDDEEYAEDDEGEGEGEPNGVSDHLMSP
jgi:hypothetical protein